MRILVADDEPFVLTLIMHVLQRTGHGAKAVVDGQEALNALEAGDFDLVITDLEMPKLSGLGVAKAVKARNPVQKVVLLTGGGHEGALPANVDYLLKKPLRINDLMALLQRVDVRPSENMAAGDSRMLR
jgi:CheY-like chemotaxis protein